MSRQSFPKPAEHEFGRASPVSTPRPADSGGQAQADAPVDAVHSGAPESVSDADGVTSDIIFGIANLRSISVIARGTAFSLRNHTPSAAATLVNAQHVASGHLRRDGKKYLVSVELIDPKSDRISWVDEFRCNAADSFFAPPLLAARIVAGLDVGIHVLNATGRCSSPPASLDAWQACHRGLVKHVPPHRQRQS